MDNPQLQAEPGDFRPAVLHYIEHVIIQPRDRAVLSAIRETLQSHGQLAHYAIEVAVRGGVAHVGGTLGSEQERTLVRRVISRVRGVHAVWDVLKARHDEQLRIIDIGCGGKKQIPWATGVDCHPFEGVDVVADLEKRLPFGDREVDHVFAVHILEHIRDLLGLMNEVHRILKPGGVFHVMVPSSHCVNSVADPTHVRFFNLQTFKFFCRRHPLLKPFRPGSVSVSTDNVFADLWPVQADEQLPSEDELAYYFD